MSTIFLGAGMHLPEGRPLQAAHSEFSWIHKNVSQNNSELSILLIGLNIRNGTYASLALISGVKHKNPSSGCGITDI